MFSKLINTKVIIRDNMAGVVFGTLEAVEGKTWRLAPGARKIHYWYRALAIEGVAVRGISNDSRVTAPFSRESYGCDLVQIAGLTEEEFSALNSVPEWS